MRPPGIRHVPAAIRQFAAIPAHRAFRRRQKLDPKRQEWADNHAHEGAVPWIRECIIQLASGAAAQRHVDTDARHVDECAADDYAFMRSLADAAFPSSRVDANELIARCRAEAEQIIDGHWPAVRALAEQLLRYGTLTQSQILATLHMCGLSEPGAADHDA
jgi:hypothetical protein